MGVEDRFEKEISVGGREWPCQLLGETRSFVGTSFPTRFWRTGKLENVIFQWQQTFWLGRTGDQMLFIKSSHRWQQWIGFEQPIYINKLILINWHASSVLNDFQQKDFTMFSSSIIMGRFRFFMICRTYFAFGTSSTHSKNVIFKSVESLEHMAKWCWASHPKVTGSSTIVVTLCLCP